MAYDQSGSRYVLFVGVIDILQSYVMKKKLEHTWKALVHDGVRAAAAVHTLPHAPRRRQCR